MVNKKNKRFSRVQWSLYLMILPSLVLLIIYSYGPLAGLGIAFQKYQMGKGLFDSKWIGFGNFDYLFKLPGFWRVIYNTVFISVIKIILNISFPMLIAILLNEMRGVKAKRLIQTTIYLPYFLSWVIVAGIMIDILNPSTGIVNVIITSLGFEPVKFLGDKNVFPWVLIFTDIWKQFGFGTIIYLATLTAINPNLYEAAAIDGANRFKKIIYITLPGLVPVLILVTTLSLGNILNAGFDQVYNMYSPIVYSTGDIIDTMAYRIAFEGSVPQFDLATAIGLLKSVVSFFFVSTSYFLAYKIAKYRIF